MWDWITELVGKFFDKAREVAAGIVGRVMATLGVSWATIEYGASNFIGFLQGHAGGVGGDVLAVIAYIRVPEVMSLIISAYTVRLASRVFLAPLRLFTGGTPAP